jgi:hypothetical protein
MKHSCKGKSKQKAGSAIAPLVMDQLRENRGVSHLGAMEGELTADEALERLVEAEEARKLAASQKNREKQMARNRVIPKKAEEVPDNWDDEPNEALPAKTDDDLGSVKSACKKEKRRARMQPANVLRDAVATADEYFGVNQYTLVDVGATDRSLLRHEGLKVRAIHTMAPGHLPTDRLSTLVPDCKHKLSACDCVQGNRLLHCHQSAQHFEEADYNALRKGDLLSTVSVELEEGGQVEINNVRHERRGDIVVTHINKKLVFADPAFVLKEPAKGRLTQLSHVAVGSSHHRINVVEIDEAPVESDLDQILDYKHDAFLSSVADGVLQKQIAGASWLTERATNLLGWLHDKIFVEEPVAKEQQEEDDAAVQKARKRAQTLLVPIDGSKDDVSVSRDLARVAATLSRESGGELTVVQTSVIVEKEMKNVLKVQDRMLGSAKNAVDHASWRVILRAKRGLRILIFLLMPVTAGAFGLYKGLTPKFAALMATMGLAGAIALLLKDFFTRGVGVLKRANSC